MTEHVVVFVEVPSGSRNKQVYKDLEEATVETLGYGNRAEAERVVVEARARATG